jgi:hypothetical protein
LNGAKTKGEAPLFRDAYSLAGTVAAELEQGSSHSALRARLVQDTLRVLDAIVLALAGIERAERLVDADADLRLLRVHMRLACDLDVVDHEFLLAVAEEADRIGRQLGGWRRQLGDV